MKKCYFILILILLTINILVCGCAVKNESSDTSLSNYETEETVEWKNNETMGVPAQVDDENLTENNVVVEEETLIESDEKLALGTYRSNDAIEISIERNDNSIMGDKGEIVAIVYYDKPVVTGDTETARKINTFLRMRKKAGLKEVEDLY